MTSQANVSVPSTELAPSARLSVWNWLRTQLFSSPLNTLLTILSVWLLFATIPALIDWFFINSTATAKTAQQCREVTGACWSMIVEKHRLILFGVYPYEEQWRPLLATLILVGVIILSGVRRFRFFPVLFSPAKHPLVSFGSRKNWKWCFGKHAK